MCRFRANTLLVGLAPANKSALVHWAIIAVSSVIVGGCGVRHAANGIDDAARRFVRLAVALGERDPDSLDFYAGPADLVADIRHDPPALETIRNDAAALRSRLSGFYGDGADTDRAKTIVSSLTAIESRVDLLTGTRLPYDRESVAFFGRAPGPLDERRMADLRQQVAAMVGGHGRLVDRYAAFAQHFTIGADRLADVMQAALDECRRRTLEYLRLPSAERVTIEFVRDRPWSAFSRYKGAALSTLQINADFRFTVDQALQIACHEGYPGHHTRNVLLAAMPDPSALWPERWIQLTFSRASLVSEAAAMTAIDMAFSPEERARVVRDRLCPLAGIDPCDAGRHVALERLVGDLQLVQADIARRYLDGELEFARAVNALEEQALVPHAEATVKYVNQYRSYVTTYTTGRTLFRAQLAECTRGDATEGERWRCFRSVLLKPEL